MALQIFKDQHGIPIATRSGLEAARCGHRYNEVLVNELPDESPYSLRGTAYHTWKRLYITSLAEQAVPADAELARACFQEAIRMEKTPTDLVHEVQDIVERHAEHFTLDLDRFFSAEEHRVRPDAPLPYVYRPDYEYVHPEKDGANDWIEVHDDKTYYVPYTEAQAAQVFQVHWNIWCAMQEFPKYNHFQFTFNFVRLNRSVSVRYNRDQFDALDRKIRAMNASRLQRHVDNDWTAVPGEVCEFCHLNCPKVDDPRRAHIRNRTLAEAIDNAQFILVLEKELKERKKALKSFATQHGAINVNDEIFDHFKTVERTYSGPAVVDQVRLLGEEPGFEVSASRLKDLFKRIPNLEHDLAGIERRKEKNRFVHKSLKSSARNQQSDEEE